MITQGGECDYSVSPTALTVSSTNASGFVWITAGSGCAWTAQSNASWITLNIPSGSGGGIVGLTMAANTSTSSRTGTVTVAGTTVTVTQAGAACTLSITPVSLNVVAGDHNIAVTAPTGCAWTASTTAAWISFPNGASGSGNGTLVVRFEPNSGTFSRSAIINVGPWRVFVSQRLGTPPDAPTGLTIR
jgi:hypothetical protein